MHASFVHLLILLFVTVLSTKAEPQNVRSIASGTSFGMCFGYCQNSINITSSPFQIAASKRPNFEHQSFPAIQKLYPFSSSQWEQLLSIIDLQKFQGINDVIGCPDCADGGAEWVQINWTTGFKRITFQYGRLVDGIENVIQKLRDMREQYINPL